MPALADLTDEQLEAYRDLLAQRKSGLTLVPQAGSRTGELRQPTAFDRFASHASGDPLAPGNAENVLPAIGNSLLRTRQAWQDLLTPNGHVQDPSDLLPLLGPAITSGIHGLANGDLAGGLGDLTGAAMGAHALPDLVSQPLESQPVPGAEAPPRAPKSSAIGTAAKIAAHYLPIPTVMTHAVPHLIDMLRGNPEPPTRVYGPALDLSTSKSKFAPQWQTAGTQPGAYAAPSQEAILPADLTLPSGRTPGPKQMPLPPPPARPNVPAHWVTEMRRLRDSGATQEPVNVPAPIDPIYPAAGVLPSGRVAGPNLNPIKAPLPIQTNATSVTPGTPALPASIPGLPTHAAGSVVIPPVEGAHALYGEYGSNKGASIADAAVAKDKNIISHLESIGVTPDQFKSAERTDRNKWLAEAAKKAGKNYAPYRDNEQGKASADRLLKVWGEQSSGK